MSNITQEIDIDKVDISIKLLNEYIKDVSVEPVISVLEAIKKEPNNETLLKQLKEALDNLGIFKGAVLTYAPYVSILVSNDLFENFD